jgi:hypothetical protein
MLKILVGDLALELMSTVIKDAFMDGLLNQGNACPR